MQTSTHNNESDKAFYWSRMDKGRQAALAPAEGKLKLVSAFYFQYSKFFLVYKVLQQFNSRTQFEIYQIKIQFVNDNLVVPILECTHLLYSHTSIHIMAPFDGVPNVGSSIDLQKSEVIMKFHLYVTTRAINTFVPCLFCTQSYQKSYN